MKQEKINYNKIADMLIGSLIMSMAIKSIAISLYVMGRAKELKIDSDELYLNMKEQGYLK